MGRRSERPVGFPPGINRRPRRLPAGGAALGTRSVPVTAEPGEFLLIAKPGGYRHRGVDISSKVGGLKELGLDEGLRMNPQDLEALDLREGDLVTLSLGVGRPSAAGPVREDVECPRGAVYFVRPVVFGGLIALAGLVLAARVGEASSVLLAFVVSLPLVFLAGLAQPRRAGLAGMTVTLFGLAWVGLAVAHAVLLRDSEHGGGIVVLVLVATFLGDTGAYFGGRAVGRRPLAPAISPHKSVEGLLLGIVAGTLGGWFTGLYQDWLSGTDALILGASVAAIAPLGDLFESFVKRQAGTKDSGTLFGAHGGVLDRLDAALFAVVAGYYVWQTLA